MKLRFSQLLKYTTPHRNTLFAVVALLLASTAITLAFPLVAGKLTQTLLSESPSGHWPVELILLLLLALMVARAILSTSSSYLIGSTGAHMSAELRSRVYEHMQVLPLAWHQDRKQGDTLSLLSNDAEVISRFVTNTVVQLLPQLTTLGFAFLVMAWLDWQIAVIAALMLPAYTVVTRLLGRRIRPLSTAWINSWSSLMAFVNENLGMMPALKAYTRESLESERFTMRNSELLDVSRKQVWLSSLLSPAIGLLAGIGAVLLLWIGIRHMQAEQLQPSELVTLLLYVMMLTSPLSALAGVYGQVMQARGAAERLLAFFGEQPEPIGLVAQHTLLLNGTVAENLAYGFPGATMEEMKKAANAARANEFIEALPDGYETIIGDQGAKLSGGQRQRLSLARALLKEPSILVLDEATAMFDPKGEKEFIEKRAGALENRTVILVTHRPASLALANREIFITPG